MAIFLTDISALQIWFGDQPTLRAPRPCICTQEYETATATCADLPDDELRRLTVRYPLHLAVPSHASVRASRKVVSHVISKPVERSFARISKSIFCAMPCAALASSAPHLPRPSLLALTNQLLGTYRLKRGRVVAGQPLATMSEFASFIQASSGLRGARPLKRILRYIVPETASPAESKLAALLTLPEHAGGYGLPIPVSNAKLSPGDNGLATSRRADFLWEPAALVVEYDSDEFHAQASSLARDSARRAQLQAAGYTIVTLTNHQIHDAREFSDVLAAIRLQLGLPRAESPRSTFSKLQRQARRDLYRYDPFGESAR